MGGPLYMGGYLTNVKIVILEALEVNDDDDIYDEKALIICYVRHLGFGSCDGTRKTVLILTLMLYPLQGITLAWV